MSKPAKSLFTIRTTINMLSAQSSVDHFLIANDYDIRLMFADGATYETLLNYVNENY